MNTQASRVRWKRVLIATSIYTVIIFAALAVYANWKAQKGWCIRFYPDGSEKMLYGADCWK
jgi:hypothetical protein